jgi:hypothetical protein
LRDKRIQPLVERLHRSLAAPKVPKHGPHLLVKLEWVKALDTSERLSASH